MQGNSLLESYEGIDLSGIAGEGKNRTRAQAKIQTSLIFDEKQAMEQIQRDLNKFYKTESHTEKESLTLSINNGVKDYIKYIAPQKSAEIDAMPVPNDKFFLWHTYFRDVFDRKGKSGFDIVIGNPPYLLCQPSNTEESLLNYYRTHFAVSSYKIDLFHLFFEQGIHLLKPKGILSFITPNTYLTNKYIRPLRFFILNNCDVLKLIIHDKVFESAQVDNATILLKKEKEKKHNVIIEKCENFTFNHFSVIDQQIWEKDKELIFNVNKTLEITFNNCTPLGKIGTTYFGIQAYDKKSATSSVLKNSKWLPIIDGGDIHPDLDAIPTNYFHYIESEIKSGGDYKYYENRRIVIRQIGKTPVSGFCNGGILGSNTLYNLNLTDKQYSLNYVYAILNSNVVKYYWTCKNSDNKALFPKIKGFQLKEIPIPIATSAQQKPIINLVNYILAAKKKNPTADTSKLEDEIDDLIYKLYGLTSEEIDIVKGAESSSSAQEVKSDGQGDKSNSDTTENSDFLQGEDL